MFTSVAAVTLAIGIGANAAIFSVVHGVLLKPLPYAHPDELISVDHAAPGVRIGNAGAAPFQYFTYREEGRTLLDIGLWRTDTVAVTGRAEPEQVVSLDVNRRGAADPRRSAAARPPVLAAGRHPRRCGHGDADLWVLALEVRRRRFGHRAARARRRRAREIIGVLPATFRFLDRKPALLLPLRLDRNKTFLGNFSFTAIARLKPGVTIAAASADVARMIPIGLATVPAIPGLQREDVRRGPSGAKPAVLETKPGRRSGRRAVGPDGTIGIVLLIACANVANLLLVRAEGVSRNWRFAPRWAPVGGRSARELMLESILLGGLGGALGLAVAFGALRFLTAIAPANLPRMDDVAVDGQVLFFTLAISIVAGVLFGSIPVIKHAGPHLGTALRAGGRTASSSRERHRARSTLVVVQVALALVLLISSALMIRTFLALRHVDPGSSTRTRC